MNILDGTSLARNIGEEMKKKVRDLGHKGIKPKLSIILVGNDPASVIYTAKKKKTCQEVGIETELVHLGEDTEEPKLIEMLEDMAADDRTHGILVQLPLPGRIDENRILEAIPESKDVDGLNPRSLGKLLSGNEGFVPCTPKGVMKLLEHYGIPIEGKNAVIINRSNLVGKPLAMLMLRKSATVTVCHSRTADIESHTKGADIIVTGVGKPDFLRADMIKTGAVIVDVGICRSGGNICGDTDFDDLKDKASYITPVPGGVGPMTVAMVMENTVIAAEKSLERQK